MSSKDGDDNEKDKALISSKDNDNEMNKTLMSSKDDDDDDDDDETMNQKNNNIIKQLHQNYFISKLRFCLELGLLNSRTKTGTGVA